MGRMWNKVSFFKRVKAGLKSVFSSLWLVALPKLNNAIYHLSQAGWVVVDGFMPPQSKWSRPEFEDKIGLGSCLPREKFEEYGRENHIGARAWHDEPTDRLWSLRPPIFPSESQRWSVVSHLTIAVVGSRTEQPSGFCPEILWVAAHVQQVALSYSSAEVQSAYSIAYRARIDLFSPSYE